MEEIKIGVGVNNSGGDQEKVAFSKINANFLELQAGRAAIENAIRTARVSFAMTARTQLRSGVLYQGTVSEDTRVNTVKCSVAEGSIAGPIILEMWKNSVVVGTITILQGETIGEIEWVSGDHHIFEQGSIATYYVVDTGTPRARGLIISAS